MVDTVRVGVGVILKRGNTILLGKRAIDVLADGLEPMENNLRETWALPGGKVEIGETLKECAIRETLEETGIIVKNAEFINLSDPDECTGYNLTVAFITEDFEGEAKTTEPDKINDWQWFFLDNLPPHIFYPSAQAIKKYLEGIYY